MLYLIDANVLIDANRDYYPLDRVPEFWTWLLSHCETGEVRMPREIWEEVADGNDDLTDWVKDSDVRKLLILDEEPDPRLVNQVTREHYAPDLTDIELEKLGRDPFLVAYASAEQASRTVVTTEASKPSKQRANRRLPDVCRSAGIDSIDTFQLIRRLDFRTRR